MKIREISADEALECLAEGSRCYILKELCEVTPVSEMMCARFVVEEAATHEPQPENSSGGGGQGGDTRKEKEDAGLGEDPGAAQGWMVPCKDRRRNGGDGEYDRHRPVKIEKGGGRQWEEAER